MRRWFNYSAKCRECDWTANRSNALALSALHHDQTGHSVDFEMRGRVSYLSEDDDKALTTAKELATERQFINAINSKPGDISAILGYAHWLDEQGDRRGEAWRVLVEWGKSPNYIADDLGWCWDIEFDEDVRDEDYDDTDRLPADLYDSLYWSESNGPWGTYFRAMDAAARAWLEVYRSG